jgi:transcriptional regulator with XRE-family HTH domain
MTFPEKMAILLGERGWKPAKLHSAVLADVAAETTVSNWVEGKNPPSLAGALRIAREFECSLEYLADDALDEDAPAARPARADVLNREEETILVVFAACLKKGMTCVDVVERMMPGWDGGRGDGEGGGEPPPPPPGLVGDAGLIPPVTDRDRSGARNRTPEPSGLGVDLDVEHVGPVGVRPPARPRRRK